MFGISKDWIAHQLRRQDNGFENVEYNIMGDMRSRGSRVFCQGTVGTDLEQAQTLLDWIREHKFKDVHPVLVYQNGPQLFRTKARAMDALEILEQHAYLIKQERGRVVDGKPRKKSWLVVDEQPKAKGS